MAQSFANKEIITLGNIKLVGLATRTSNKNEFNPTSAKIKPLITSYWSDSCFNKISNRKTPLKVFAAYTNYASNEHGYYDYFFGEEVTEFTNIVEGLTSLIIPPGKYLKLTTYAAPMPELVINAWQNIWKMNLADFGGERSYKTDFEIYDERSLNPECAVIDIYLGIK